MFKRKKAKLNIFKNLLTINYRSEWELLNIENDQLRSEIYQLKKKYATLNSINEEYAKFISYLIIVNYQEIKKLNGRIGGLTKERNKLKRIIKK